MNVRELIRAPSVEWRTLGVLLAAKRGLIHASTYQRWILGI